MEMRASLERMLRIYFLEQWFNLGDPTVEEALYDSRAMEAFAKIDLGRAKSAKQLGNSPSTPHASRATLRMTRETALLQSFPRG